MRKWSQKLDEDFFDEDQSEIDIGSGDGSRTVSNHVVTVRGKLEGQGLVLMYHDYHVEGFQVPTVRRHLFDVFVVDKSVKFDGKIKTAGFLDKMLRAIGLKKSLKPSAHTLFADCLLTSDEKPPDVSEFEVDAYCDGLSPAMAGKKLEWIEWIENSSMNAFLRVAPANVTEAYIGKVVGSMRDLLQLRN